MVVLGGHVCVCCVLCGVVSVQVRWVCVCVCMCAHLCNKCVLCVYMCVTCVSQGVTTAVLFHNAAGRVPLYAVRNNTSIPFVVRQMGVYDAGEEVR